MDKSSDDSMAPALHTTEHDNSSASIKYHLPLTNTTPQTDLSENTVYEQMNGGHADSESDAIAKLTPERESDFRPVKQCVNHVNSVTMDSDLIDLKSNGGSGDYLSSVSLLQKDIKKKLSKPHPTSEKVNGGGDAVKEVHKSNGWSPEHKTDESQLDTRLHCKDSINGQQESKTTSSKNTTMVTDLHDSCTDANCPTKNASGGSGMGNSPVKMLTHVGDSDRISLPMELDCKNVDLSTESIHSKEETISDVVLPIGSQTSTSISDTSSISGKLQTTVPRQPPSPLCKNSTNNSSASGTDSVDQDVFEALNDLCDSVVRIHKNCLNDTTLNKCDEGRDISESPFPELEPVVSSDLQLTNIFGLAQSLITGNHMQNLPPKLTNTLHELAASLQNMPSSGDNKSEMPDNKPRRRSSSKSLNFEEMEEKSVSRITNKEELLAKQSEQMHEVLKRYSFQRKNLVLLKARLSKIRCSGVNKAVKKQIGEVIKTCDMNFSNFENLDLEKLPEMHTKAQLFWKHTLQNRKQRKSSFDGLDVDNSNYPMSHINTDSKLTDVRSSQFLHETAAFSTGLLKKEVRFVQSTYDPDLTESSSDEELVDCVYKSGEGYVPRKKTTKPKIAHYSSLDRGYKHKSKNANQTWLQQRLSVAKRWTWLQAQVSDLEFKIRSHNELIRQLRSCKDEVTLGHQQISTSFVEGTAVSEMQRLTPMKVDSTSSSPCSVSKLVQNINKQTTNLLDNLSPLSAGVPSPVTQMEHGRDIRHMSDASINVDKTSVAARTRPLCRPLRHRQLVKAQDVAFLSNRTLAPPTVTNESRIMGEDFARSTPFHRSDGKLLEVVGTSLQYRAAQHDHSYHRILSTEEDIPLSLRLSSFMKSSQKWFNEKTSKREKRHEKKKRRKNSKNKAESLAEKIKTRPRSATVVLERMKTVGAMQRSHSGDAYLSESRNRRGSVQAMSEYHKRQRMNSMDSDAEGAHYRSGANTPTQEQHGHAHMQAFLKRKRQSDQAYDINNIVIPHGLTTTRIEKLQYKEILTPGWRTADEKTQDEALKTAADDAEALDDGEFRSRHDRYEVLEKKKYMAYMEWSRHKKNGTRSMSRANMLSSVDATQSPGGMFQFSQSMRSSPVAHMRSPDPSSPGSPESNPTSVAGIRTRRTSSDVFRPPSIESSSSVPPSCNTRERHLSSADEGGSVSRHSGEWHPIWEPRNFPLTDGDYEELMKKPVVPDVQPPKPRIDSESPESRFRPISRQPSVDTNTAPRHRTVSKQESGGNSRKRPRTASMLSNRDEDRQSDESLSSSHSSYRRPSSYIARKDDVTHSSQTVPQTAGNGLPKRHKPNHKQDFYFYSDLDMDIGSETESVASDDEDAMVISEDENRWTRYPVAYTALGGKEQSDEGKVPLVMTFKRK